MLLPLRSRRRLWTEGYHHDLKQIHNDVFSESTFGEKAAAALSKTQPPNSNSAATISDYRLSCNEWHAGWHFYFANSPKDPSLPCSGSTVFPEGCWQSAASNRPAWNKHDLTEWCALTAPEFVPLSPSHFVDDLKCLYAFGSGMWKEKRAKTRNRPVSSFLWLNPSLVREWSVLQFSDLSWEV